jgi:short-subunit dehydrogenase
MASESKAALVVGAGPRLGAAIARRLARQGYTAALISRRAESVAQVGETLRAEGIDAYWEAADVSRPGELTAAIRSLASRAGVIDVAVHNISTWRDAGVLDLAPSELLADLAVGTVSLLTIAQAVAPAMIERGHGTILATGSSAADSPTPGAPSLGLQKAALRVLVRGIAPELALQGVHCATVTIDGFIGKGAFAPDRIADVYAELVAETDLSADTWRTVVPYQG